MWISLFFYNYIVAEPSKPRQVDASNQTDTSFIISWKVPAHPAGTILRYKVMCSSLNSKDNKYFNVRGTDHSCFIGKLSKVYGYIQ